MSFSFQLLVYYSDCFFLLFSLGGGSVFPGAMLIYHVPLSSPGGLHLPKLSGSWLLVVWAGFSVYHGVGMLCAGWRCGGVGFLSLLVGFSYQVYLQHLSKILL
jgi:hypothetical protein